jgi:hypothetical protein
MITTLFVLISISNAEICPKFSCGSLPNELCSYKSSVDPESHVLKKCSAEKPVCPFYNHENSFNVTCIEKSSRNIKLYPGGPCNADSDCFSAKCNNSTCVGVSNNVTCSGPEDCNYGFTCRKIETSNSTTCIPQAKEKESCLEDYDCVNTHGCYNKTCVAYFSLPDGHPVESDNPITQSLCQSGYQRDLKCASLKLNGGKNFECNETNICTYTNYNNSTILLPENCLCGLNPSGKKYCKLGSGEDEFKKYVKNALELLNNTHNCNTLERDTCNHNKKLSNKPLNLLVGKYTNSKINALYFHQLVGADKCAVNVAFADYVEEPEPPAPKYFTCGKYTCKTNQKTCAHSHFTNTSLEITLSDICKKDNICYVGGRPNDVFYNPNKTEVDGTCRITENPTSNLRFPGESCLKDEDCFYLGEKINSTKLGKCVNKFCGGYGSKENCTSTSDCLIGLYCSAENKCSNLKKLGENCTKTNECLNSLGCYEGKCKNVLYSLPVGTSLKNVTDTEKGKYCIYGRIFNDACDYMNSTDIYDNKTKLVICTPGSSCNYTTLNGTKTLPCECGYNADGFSYCPKGTNIGN